MTTEKKEVDQAWKDYFEKEWYPGQDLFDAIYAYKAALRVEIEKDRDDYIRMRDGWKEGTKDWEVYDLVVRVLHATLKKLDTVTPKEK